MGCKDLADLQTNHKRWVQASLEAKDTARQAQWTESIATGSRSFVEQVKKSLGVKARGKSISGDNQQYQLRENVSKFGNSRLQRFDNTFLWEDS